MYGMRTTLQLPPLHDLVEWFSKLLDIGPSYGYYPEPKKCVLIVHQDHLVNPLVCLLRPVIVLGSVIGCDEGTSHFISDQVNEWKSLISKLVLIAESQPQLAYSAFTRSLQSQWTYFQRVTPNCGTFFDPLEDIITRQLLPTLFGCELSTNERTLLSLPTRMSGLNILNPVVTAQLNYTTSRRLTNPIVKALTLNTDLDFDEFHHHYYTVHQEVTKERDISAENTFGDCFSGLSTAQQRAVLRAKDEKISLWLNVIPTSKHHFDLSAQMPLHFDIRSLFCVFLPSVMAVEPHLTSLMLLSVGKVV